MKSSLIFLSFVLGSPAFAADSVQASHPCKKAVLRQAKEKLANEIMVSGITVKSVEMQGEDLNVFTLTVSSTTRTGNTKVTELYEAKTDSSCHIQSLDMVPDSQVIDEK